MENEQTITVDTEEMAQWIHEKTGVDKDDIDVVLAAELDYYIEIGLVTPQEESGE